MAYCNSLSDVQVKSNILPPLLVRWGEQDPLRALEYANKLFKRADRDSALSSVLQGWAETDLTAAAEWAQKLPKGELRNRSLQAVIGAMARENPEAAFSYARSVVPWNAPRTTQYFGAAMGGGGDFTYQMLFSEWARQDVKAALSAAETSLLTTEW